MNTFNNSRTTKLDRDSFYYLEQNLKISNFSRKTIHAYLYYNKELLRFANFKSTKEICGQDIKDYLEYLLDNGKSSSTLNLAINAIKYYYKNLLNRKFFDGMKIKRPKNEKKLPVVLSKQEIVKMIEVADNIKHKLVIQVLYSSGLRVGELADLKINDIDFNRKNIHVFSGKGQKDRITIISEVVLRNIERYLLEHQPLIYLFEGLEAGRKMNVRSFQKIVYQLSQKADIKKEVSTHSLRHSFATHNLENGVNLRYIQSMLGHARLETTQIYTKVAVNKLNEIEDLL